MLKGNLTSLLLAVVAAVSLVVWVQTYRLGNAKDRARDLENKVAVLVAESEYRTKLYNDTLVALEESRASTTSTRKQIEEARKDDPTVDDWLSQPIPPRLLDSLR